MQTSLRFFGVAAYELIASGGQHIWLDPFLDGNPGSPIGSAAVERVDLILVTHAAFDHLGDTEALARRTGAPVVCGGEVKAYLTARGLPPAQIRATTWGIAVEVAGVRIQPVECHHWSQIQLPDGSFASGQPMGFVVELAADVRFYHYGDTALFSDLKLLGDLYRPTIGCVGVTNPVEILHRLSGPGRLVTGEMSPREAALASQWLGLETVLPCHYITPYCNDVREFERLLLLAKESGGPAPQSLALRPGEVLQLPVQGR